ncbi:imidazole glycerol phosphate synthase subunit HisH [Neisseria sp. N95_16]|uniref:Imidazole glycerol phosphate synthase subunit HisH n=1 Tax=Neisseria brasiliensis TaxID=2666100 RepID=A0A5Q3S1U1_9NEIS|nr:MULTISPECIES: imidazole glycerol phosphate synthase subunit HisH [Neisseria]MRN37548.1 imidazole glycerol phosphate synthase subunit HisH [Neisseria brasiliensis]PJO09184.1 imidazole glycerol phosphate synthase subunit HisH [Neisseria sp. N95_16]PJO79324.1 imidazole glycerol phosphate synthase subunit HisH [Neisseria sp. N177_16]QGL24536.1 imidazole glycerol phosphate synthase subunit HisH [Neisseria brasiliensis]
MKVAVVDYGMGNLHSVLKSVQAAQKLAGLQADIFLTDQPDEVFAADKIIFPGQGAMPDCMSALQQSGLGEAVSDGLKNKPFFGICVGAQLLFDHSEEGDTAGLGWFAGGVKRFAANRHDTNGDKLKVPHMGWNAVRQTQNHPLFADIAQDTRFYFVHSYYFAPQNNDIVLGTSEYPQEFACIVGKDNVFATQFHTEKSHDGGLLLLRNFLNWQP